MAGWYGLFAPAMTPAAVVERLHAETNAALQIPSVRERYAMLGLDPVGSSPAEFKRFLAEQVRRYAELVRTAKIEPQ
jgi:tripartite-type tricarboxylate transporter receptor subunit TctC